MESNTKQSDILGQLKNYLILLSDAGYSDIPIATNLSPGKNIRAPIKNNSKLNAGDDPLSQIREELGECTRCKLAGGRKTIVFGSGNPQADLVFIGEGPGADEDEQGLPFVGRAGKKLTEIIEKGMGLSREKDVYICNIIKCRPPGNRDPEKDEIEACKPFLLKQIRAIRPKVIVALGKPASSVLLGRNVPITKERGIWHEFEGAKLMLTLHPAYLLRAYTLENRRAVQSDMNLVLEALGRKK